MVTLTNSSLNKEGQAFISVGGNRLKQYNKNTVYLENGKEFQAELFNPKTTKILVKIKINGNYISSSGIVLKPGQRIFLERYLDDAKKFKFETYTVENSKEAIEAIAKNGLVEFEFYDEQVAIPYIYWNNFNYGSIGNNFYNALNTNITNCCYNSDSTKLNTESMGFTSSYNAGENLRSFTSQPKYLKKSVASTKSVETGRVEKGSASNQTFNYDNSSYNSWTSNVVTWKILPTSQKPIEVSDLKIYCTSCGLKKKRTSWTYCPQCSTKFE